jgi:hypothetical protein
LHTECTISSQTLCVACTYCYLFLLETYLLQGTLHDKNFTKQEILYGIFPLLTEHELFTSVTWDIRPSSWIYKHQCFRWTCCIHLQVSRLLWNTDNYPPNRTYRIPQECKIPVFCDTGWEVPNILKARAFLIMALGLFDPLRHRHYNTMKHYNCPPKNSVTCQKNGIFSKTTVRT